MPTYVNPNGASGYTVQTPGQMPTYVQPKGAVQPGVGVELSMTVGVVAVRRLALR